MIDFQKIDLSKKEEYKTFLKTAQERGCGYSLVNLFIWGQQRAAFLNGCLTLFSQFEKSSVYPFPVGEGDMGAVLDAILHDAGARGLVCRLTNMTAEDCALLEERYPGKFRFHPDRAGCDYVYNIEKLAKLPGRKYQRKRNHLNRFRLEHPNAQSEVITVGDLPEVMDMVQKWYENHRTPETKDEFHMEQVAFGRAFAHWTELELEGIVLRENGRILAMTMGSFLNDETFDVHFEKALEDGDGTYAAINQAFAAHLHKKYPKLRYLNREDDLGLPGLRQAKLSYYPDHMVVKFWANLWEDDDEN